jgi:hypothetical protein
VVTRAPCVACGSPMEGEHARAKRCQRCRQGTPYPQWRRKRGEVVACVVATPAPSPGLLARVERLEQVVRALAGASGDPSLHGLATWVRSLQATVDGHARLLTGQDRCGTETA